MNAKQVSRSSSEKTTAFFKRLPMAILAVLLLLLIFRFAQEPFARYVVAGCISLLIAGAYWEFFQMALKKTRELPVKAGLFLAYVYSYTVFLETEQELWAHSSQALILFAFASFFALAFRQRKNALTHLALCCFGFLYIPVTLSYLIRILYFFPPDLAFMGTFCCAYLIVICKMTDTGAYLFGSLFGKRKLAPEISPEKTFEGAVAGTVLAMATGAFLCFAGKRLEAISAEVSWVPLLVITFALSLLAHFGDLAESLLKRDAGVKDSNQVPGLGGILDTCDSLIFAGPALYLLLGVFVP